MGAAIAVVVSATITLVRSPTVTFLGVISLTVLPMPLKLVRIRRLQQLQADRGAKGPVELGRIIGRKTNQTSDLLKGRTAFGERVARSIEANAGLPMGWLDQNPEDKNSEWQDGPASMCVLVAPLQIAEGAARDSERHQGEHQTTFAGSLPLTRTWVASLQGHQDTWNLRYLEAPDDLMEPTFHSGDLLLIDTSSRAFAFDAVYVLRTNARLYVRRVRQRIDGRFEVSADSSTVKTSEAVTIEQIDFVGRVLYAWRGRKL